MEITIRAMKNDDWEDVSAIYKTALAQGHSTFQTDCPSFNEWDSVHIRECRLAAVCESKVVGWCALSRTSKREAYKGVAEVSIYVDKAYRNNGIGRKLLDELCKISEENGYWCLYAAIFEVNKASIELHKKCGFREIGYREKIAKDRFGVWQNTILMERRNLII